MQMSILSTFVGKDPSYCDCHVRDGGNAFVDMIKTFAFTFHHLHWSCVRKGRYCGDRVERAADVRRMCPQQRPGLDYTSLPRVALCCMSSPTLALVSCHSLNCHIN